MDRFSVYLLAFKGGGHTHHFEFDNIINGEHKSLIDHPLVPLDFNGSYSDGNGVGYRSSRYRYQVVLRHSTTMHHLRILHKYDPDKGKTHREVSKAMIYMIQLLAELPRFRTILKHVDGRYFDDEDYGESFDKDMILDQNAWIRYQRSYKDDLPNYDQLWKLGLAKRAEGWLSDAERKENSKWNQKKEKNKGIKGAVGEGSSLLDFRYLIGSLVPIKYQTTNVDVHLGDAVRAFRSIKGLSQSYGRWRYSSNNPESSTYAAGIPLEALAE